MEATTDDAASTGPKLDPIVEIKAMTAIASAFEKLDAGQIHRVLGWANHHYLQGSIALSTTIRAAAAAAGEASGAQTAEYADLPAVLAAAPVAVSGPDRALLAGYYLQVVLGQSDFDGFNANKELKHAGHASGNITRDLDALMARAPQLVVQTRKHGNSKQARKLYRLTAAGVAAAKGRLAD